MVHADAFCWICEEHLKRPWPATCEADPVSMHGVLAYSVGSVADWTRRFMAHASMISVCDEFLMHGMYDGGHAPYASVFEDAKGRRGIVSVHNGIQPGTVGADLDMCGAPLTNNDVIMDSWTSVGLK